MTCRIKKTNARTLRKIARELGIKEENPDVLKCCVCRCNLVPGKSCSRQFDPVSKGKWEYHLQARLGS